MKIPAQITAGDSTSWIDSAKLDNQRRSISSPDWTLTYYLRGKTQLDLVAEPSGAGFRTPITAVQSATLQAGTYYWSAVATKDDERITLGTGEVEILPNLGTVTTEFDGRSQAEKDLDTVRAAIRKHATGGISSYSIGGREIRNMPMADLLALESKLKVDVLREKQAEARKNGGPNPMSRKVRFTR